MPPLRTKYLGQNYETGESVYAPGLLCQAIGWLFVCTIVPVILLGFIGMFYSTVTGNPAEFPFR